MMLIIYVNLEEIMEEKLDKTTYCRQSLKSADNNTAYWLSRSMPERLQAAYMLSLRVYGYDPEHPPAMDKRFIKKRRHFRKG